MAWDRTHAERLLWRAGLGGRPAEIDAWGGRSRAALVDWLLLPGEGRLHGPAPIPLDPVNEWSHDALAWLDRMVRTDRPLRERMVLLWHDHLAVREQEAPLMLARHRTLRRHALGSFPALLAAITRDPATQDFLSLVDSDKREPNENFARELMELFTLGAGAGYTERDVREAARALTGWRGTWDDRPLRVRYVRERHDGGVKTIFGRRGRFDWRDVLRLCVEHPAHPGFLVTKLWSHFSPDPIRQATKRDLARTYVRSGRRIAPVVRKILLDPALTSGERTMVTWPVVLVAGRLRSMGRGVDTDAWGWLLPIAGQQPLHPPNVAGWDTGGAWLSTSTARARAKIATQLIHEAGPAALPDDWRAPDGWDAARHVEAARDAVGRPWTSPATDAELLGLAQGWLADDGPTRGLQLGLRHLLLLGPDAHLC